MEDNPRGAAGGRLAPLILVIAIAAVIQWPHLKTPFAGDDLRLIDAVGFGSLAAAPFAEDPLGDAFRPVGRQLYFALVSHWGGGDPVMAHAANLVLFLIALGLLGWIARRLVGPYPAAIAVALVAVGYAADVTVLWASGGQYVAALVFALAAIALTMAGAAVPAGIALFLGLLSHEAVALAPLVALAARPRPRDPRERRPFPWPLFAAVGAWALLWLVAVLRHPGALRPALRGDAIAAAFAHLLQVAIGLEWDGRGLRAIFAWGSIPLAFAATLAIAWASARRRGPRGPQSSRADRLGPRGMRIGLLWAIAGTLPLIPTAPAWSAHHYLFALCGLALLIGSWVARQGQWLGPTLVAVVSLASANTRALDAVAKAPDAWSSLSHVNRHSVMRDVRSISFYAAELERVRPALPRGSVLFFSGLPDFWKVGGGRLVRHAYRDSSLRAYDLDAFSLARAKRGPVFFFGFDRDRVRELTPADLRDAAVSAFRRDRDVAAYEALQYAVESAPDDWLSRYWLTWVEWSRGDTSAAIVQLRRLGLRPLSGDAFEWQGSWSQRTLAVGDSAGSIELLGRVVKRRALDPEPHRRLAELMARTGDVDRGEAESYAARVLRQRPTARRSAGRSESTAAILP